MHPAQSNPVPELRTDPVTLSMYILAEQHIKARAPALCQCAIGPFCLREQS